VLDPFAGTGTTSIVARQLNRNSISIESSEKNYFIIKKRHSDKRKIDDIGQYRDYYAFTEHLDQIWEHEGKKNVYGSLWKYV
jgi:DNA modification methylase